MKKKIKDLTIRNIIDTDQKYKGKCTECPLYSISEIHCMTFCEMPREEQILIEKALEQELEVDSSEEKD